MEQQSDTNLTMMVMEAMNTIRDAIVIVDKESRIIYINEAYTRILNVTREQVMHKRVSVIEPGALILDVLHDGKARRRQPVKIKTRGKHILVNISPIIKNHAVIGAVSIFEDMTELSRSMHELKRAQQLSHSIFKAAGNEATGQGAAFTDIIGKHPKFMRCLRLIELVAPTDATVLIEGESGAGKEVMVNAVMRLCGTRKKPFVNLNCSAIPESLLESELFGYTGGSFTGAAKGGKMGKFEQADGGTIFLDEIGELPLFMQAKLLRVLQSGEIQKIGSQAIQTVDVRVIAATNRNLKQMVQEGKFREDLYFRLHTFTILIPPLRERGEDILLLAAYFLKKFADKYHKPVRLHPAAAQALLSYSWPGNVRELESSMEYAVIVCNSDTITTACLPEEVQVSVPDEAPAAFEIVQAPKSGGLKTDVAALEREQMIQALQQTKGNKTKAIELLGISRRTFYKKWKQYNLDQLVYTK